MLVALALIWGSSFFFAELALRELPPLTIVLHRVVYATLLLGAFAWLRGLVLPRSPRAWLAFLVMGALNNAIPFSLIFWGQTTIDSGLAAILNSSTAFFGVVVAGIFLADERMSSNKLVGALVGFIGVAVIIGPQSLLSFSLLSLAQLAVLGATLSYALASVWGRARLSEYSDAVNTLGMLIGSTLLMIPVVLFADGVPRLNLAGTTWGALLTLSVLCTAVAYPLYFGVLRLAGSANLLLVTLLIPPVSMALGAAYLGERISGNALFGFGIVVVGLLITDGRLFARWRRSAA